MARLLRAVDQAPVVPGHDADVPIASMVALAARGSRPGKSLADTLASHERDDGDQPDSRPCTATMRMRAPPSRSFFAA
jgi:hypothetical protein